jgi:ubiquinone/menaquinone biosynthesis C-methylase UbiE
MADKITRFTFSSHNFDLVRSQMMVSGIHTTRWTQYMRDMFRVTRPGGWCQMVEMYLHVQSDNGTLTDGWSIDPSSSLWPATEDPSFLRSRLEALE